MSTVAPIVTGALEPKADCGLCPRLAEFRTDNAAKFPDYFNAPVPAFGPLDAPLWIIGLAPGLKGANRTGRPFTGDYAGDLLYDTLVKFDFAEGRYEADPEDTLKLKTARIINAVRCVPPQNKPVGAEINTCNQFLTAEFNRPEARPRVVICLGTIAHAATLAAMGYKKSHCKFGHAASHKLPNEIMLLDSYHCSRYNTNTGRLTTEMFEDVFAIAKKALMA
ncbi:MAG: uracil-DNA glycosylase [Alphaproteobacteria bacterium]